MNYAATPESKEMLRVAMAWSHRKNFLLFLTNYSFLVNKNKPKDGSTSAEHSAVQADPTFAEPLNGSPSGRHTYTYAGNYTGTDGSGNRHNAVHRVFDIEDMDRFICSFL